MLWPRNVVLSSDFPQVEGPFPPSHWGLGSSRISMSCTQVPQGAPSPGTTGSFECPWSLRHGRQSPQADAFASRRGAVNESGRWGQPHASRQGSEDSEKKTERQEGRQSRQNARTHEPPECRQLRWQEERKDETPARMMNLCMVSIRTKTSHQVRLA